MHFQKMYLDKVHSTISGKKTFVKFASIILKCQSKIDQ